MSRPPVAVIGGVGLDTQAYLYTPEPDFSVEMNFAALIDNVGQAGGYSARLLAALGYPTRFVGYVGDDPAGALIRQVFAEEGIDATFYQDPEGTARSVNVMYGDGRRKNFPTSSPERGQRRRDTSAERDGRRRMA